MMQTLATIYVAAMVLPKYLPKNRDHWREIDESAIENLADRHLLVDGGP